MIPVIGNELREVGFDVFDEWFAGGKIADDEWQAYEQMRGNTYYQALETYYAKHIFKFDKFHLDRADIGVMALPAGKSGHLELGYLIGQGKPGYILFDKQPERWDIMVQFATGIFEDTSKLVQTLKKAHIPW